MNEPKIRFKGFIGEWETAPLDECVEFLDNLRKPIDEGSRIKGIYPYYGASGIVDYIHDYIFDEELILLSEDGANITDRNYPVCFLASGKYWVNNHAHVLRTKEDFVNNFVCNAMERKDYSLYNTGMAMPKLNKEVCKRIPLSYPVKGEQQAIADYFQNIGSLILSVTKKIESLKQVKAASLQSMFPQEGETTPRVRFKGFVGEWNIVSIDSVCKKSISKHSENSLGKNTGQYPIYGASGYIQNIKTFDFDVPYVGIIKDGSGVGRSQLYPAFSSILGTMQYILPKGDTDVVFLSYLFETIDFSSYVNGSSIPHIYFKDYCSKEIKVPIVNEQKAIGAYFRNLDSQISLLSQRLEKLQQIKSACLDNMFV